MRTSLRIRWSIVAMGALCAVALVAHAAVRAQSADPWKDPDGNPLPFETDEELIEFLGTASIEDVASIPIGVTAPHSVTLVKDGITARAALRDFEETYEQVRIEGVFYGRLRDSFVWDLPAYKMSRLLGLDNVPPVARRRVNGRQATVQIWLEGGLMERDRVEQDIRPPALLPFRRQQQVMRVFDSLIGNTDRNTGNILFDDNWKFWLIDHSRAFINTDHARYLPRVYWCEKGLFERIKELDRETLRAEFSELLTNGEIDAMLQRRDKIVDHIEGLIADRGEEAVLFEWPSES